MRSGVFQGKGRQELFCVKSGLIPIVPVATMNVSCRLSVAKARKRVYISALLLNNGSFASVLL